LLKKKIFFLNEQPFDEAQAFVQKMKVSPIHYKFNKIFLTGTVVGRKTRADRWKVFVRFDLLS